MTVVRLHIVGCSPNMQYVNLNSNLQADRGLLIPNVELSININNVLYSINLPSMYVVKTRLKRWAARKS